MIEIGQRIASRAECDARGPPLLRHPPHHPVARRIARIQRANLAEQNAGKNVVPERPAGSAVRIVDDDTAGFAEIVCRHRDPINSAIRPHIQSGERSAHDHREKIQTLGRMRRRADIRRHRDHRPVRIGPADHRQSVARLPEIGHKADIIERHFAPVAHFKWLRKIRHCIDTRNRNLPFRCRCSTDGHERKKDGTQTQPAALTKMRP